MFSGTKGDLQDEKFLDRILLVVVSCTFFHPVDVLVASQRNLGLATGT